jgi:hypothetical protein
MTTIHYQHLSVCSPMNYHCLSIYHNPKSGRVPHRSSLFPTLSSSLAPQGPSGCTGPVRLSPICIRTTESHDQFVSPPSLDRTGQSPPARYYLCFCTMPRLTIRIPARRLCTLCLRVHAVLDLQHPDRAVRCRSCNSRELCSACNSLKKRKHFFNAKHANRLYKTCERCRSTRIARVHFQREAAHALGFRWCTMGSHQVPPVACTSLDGTVHTKCSTTPTGIGVPQNLPLLKMDLSMGQRAPTC